MARRTPPTPPQAPVLNGAQIRSRIVRIQRCIEELEAFNPENVHQRSSTPEVLGLQASIADALQAAFGQGTERFNLFRGAIKLDQGPIVMRAENRWLLARHSGVSNYDAQDARDAHKYLIEGKHRSIELLRRAVRTLEDDLQDAGGPAEHTEGETSVASERKVFIVHGHDEGTREAVARFLEKVGFEALILNEKANQGRTVIEKVEAHSDVGFAVILLTPDDEGRMKGSEQLQSRARQNVLLELGYFIGRLGRERVCTLKVGELEIPSDWRGVIDEPFDSGGGWRQTLARELAAAGYELDWNKVMR